MTLEVPVWLEAVSGDTAITYSGRQIRTWIDALVPTLGVVGSADLAVSQRAAGANFTVDVAAGLAVILGTSVANQGKYVARNTATVNVTLTGAPGSGTRYDLIYAQVRDKQADGGSAYDWVIDDVPGTVGAGQVQAAGGGGAATPANAIPLAQVGPIVSSTPSITNSLITSLRAQAMAAGAVRGAFGNAGRKTLRGTVTPITWASSVASGTVTFAETFAVTPTVVAVPLGYITANTQWGIAIPVISTTSFDWEARLPAGASSFTGSNQPGFRWIATDA